MKLDIILVTNEISQIFFIKFLEKSNFDKIRQARELAGPGLRSELMTMRSNISSLEEAFLAISSISERLVRRSLEETSDMAGLSRELASLSNNTVLSILDDEAELSTPEIPDQIRDFN